MAKQTIDQRVIFNKQVPKVNENFTELYDLFGSATSADLTKLHAVTATADELNLLDTSYTGSQRIIAMTDIPSPPDGSQEDTTLIVPEGSIIEKVWIKVSTKEDTGGTKTMDIGIKSGDDDGFCAGLDCSAAGVVLPEVALDGGGAFWDTTTYGVFLANFIQGTDSDDRGLFNLKDYLTVADTTITIKAGSNDWAEFLGLLYVQYVKFA